MHSLIEKLLPKRILGYLHPKDGITMSEANHIANMTKQIAEVSASKVQNMVSSVDTIVIDGNEHTLKEYSKPSPDDFRLPGKLFGLSAWLRQAIRAKETGIDMITNANLSDVLEGQPVSTLLMPQKSSFKFPDRLPATIDTTEPLGLILDIAEYAEYLALEARAAFLGKAIHQGQPVDKVREQILNWQPISFMKINNAEHLVKRAKVYSESEINTLYLGLQAEHREVESKLNWYKAKIKNDAVVLQAKATEEYTIAYNKAQMEYSEAMRQYNDAMRENEKQFSLWSADAQQKRRELQKLFTSYRIIIPNHFTDIYEFIQKTLAQKL